MDMDEPADLMSLAAAVAAEDPVCECCTGRLVADRSFGVTNRERGQTIRLAACLISDEPYEPPNPDDCWVCEGHTTRLDTWAERVVEGVSEISFSTYQIGTRIPPLLEENDRLLRESVGLDPDAGEPLKRELNREVGKRVGHLTGTEVDFDRPDVVALLHLDRGTVEVSINPAFVYGRYRKLERGIPQTEWPCSDCGGSGKQLGQDGTEPCDGCDGSGYRYDRSVEGLTAPLVADAMDGSEGIFHGAGREDVDAKMIGTGRPFVIEVKDPRIRHPNLADLETTINDEAGDAIEVVNLRFATYEMVERVKELPASKRYRAAVTFSRPVDEDAFENALRTLEGAVIEQYTPQRVDHRRASLVRERTVYDIEGSLDKPTTATVELHGEGGLYVKELISGDDGRTEPSLAGLLSVEASVDALDVLAVKGEDEPFDDPAYVIEEPTTETNT